MIRTRVQPPDYIPIAKYEKIQIVKDLLAWLCGAASRAMDADDQSVQNFEEEVRKMLDALAFPGYALSVLVMYGDEVTVHVNCVFRLDPNVNAWVPIEHEFNIR